MKKYPWLFALLLCGLVSLLVVRPWEGAQETPAVKGANERKIPSKSAGQNTDSARYDTAVEAAWKKVGQRKPRTTWVPTDAGRTRKQLFEGIIDDTLKSLDLGPNGAARLLSDFELVDDLRVELEAPMVQVISFQHGVLKLHIPAYPEMGQDMRDILQAALARDFSMEQSEKIMELTGSDLGLMFRGFGTMDQTFVVTRLNTEDQSLSVDWRLALARKPDHDELVRGVWGGSAGTVAYPLKSFDRGTFASLRPALQKHFGGAAGGTN